MSATIKDAMVAAGLSEEEALGRFYVIEKDGLLAKDGMADADFASLAPEQQAFATNFAHAAATRGDSLLDVIAYAKPTMLIGASTVAGLFDEAVVKTFHANVKPDRPIIMPLSNPTSKCEVS